jgi:hypothetical protein
MQADAEMPCSFGQISLKKIIGFNAAADKGAEKLLKDSFAVVHAAKENRLAYKGNPRRGKAAQGFAAFRAKLFRVVNVDDAPQGLAQAKAPRKTTGNARGQRGGNARRKAQDKPGPRFTQNVDNSE